MFQHKVKGHLYYILKRCIGEIAAKSKAHCCQIKFSIRVLHASNFEIVKKEGLVDALQMADIFRVVKFIVTQNVFKNEAVSLGDFCLPAIQNEKSK